MPVVAVIPAVAAAAGATAAVGSATLVGVLGTVGASLAGGLVGGALGGVAEGAISGGNIGKDALWGGVGGAVGGGLGALGGLSGGWLGAAAGAGAGAGNGYATKGGSGILAGALGGAVSGYGVGSFVNGLSTSAAAGGDSFAAGGQTVATPGLNTVGTTAGQTGGLNTLGSGTTSVAGAGAPTDATASVSAYSGTISPAASVMPYTPADAAATGSMVPYSSQGAAYDALNPQGGLGAAGAGAGAQAATAATPTMWTSAGLSNMAAGQPAMGLSDLGSAITAPSAPAIAGSAGATTTAGGGMDLSTLGLLSGGQMLYGMYQANQLKGQLASLAAKEDPLATQRAGYAQQLQQLMSNPGEYLSQQPGYKAGLDAVERSYAAQGYQGSGNMMAALQQYGGNAYQQAFQNLYQLSGGGNSQAATNLQAQGLTAATQIQGQSMSNLGLLALMMSKGG